MSYRPFLDQSNQPTDQTLQATLGDTYPYYKQIIGLASSFLHEWIFTSSGGWMLKIHDPQITLLHLIPLSNGFDISLTIRAAEREAFLRDDELRSLRHRILSSKRYAEGFTLQFNTSNVTELHMSELLIGKLIAVRTAGDQ